MSRVTFLVPELKAKGAWVDVRSQIPGGYGWRSNISLSNYKFAVAHHTVTNPQKNAKAEVDYIWQLHKKRGWGGIGYNFIITSEEVNGYAKVAYVGDLGNMRAHTPNDKGSLGIRARYGNMYLIGIAIIGRFDQGKTPTDAQLRSAYELFKELIWDEDKRMPNLKNTWDSMRGHKEFDSTACPGDLNAIKKLIIGVGGVPKDFDGNTYLKLNPDVKKANFPPMAHYILYGKSEGRKYKEMPQPKPNPTPDTLARLAVLAGYKGDSIDEAILVESIASRLKMATLIEGDLRNALLRENELKVVVENLKKALLGCEEGNKKLQSKVSTLTESNKAIIADFDKAFWNRVSGFISKIFGK